MAHKITVWIVGAFIAYSLGSYASLYLLNRAIPAWAENLIVTVVLLLQLLFAPWMELLRNAGLTEGEWIRVPTFGRCLLVIAVYALLLYMLVWVIFCTYGGHSTIGRLGPVKPWDPALQARLVRPLPSSESQI